MLTALCLAIAIGHGQQTWTPSDFKKLLQRRIEFESVLKEPKGYTGYIHLRSEMLGGAHADALYPIGKADERYILDFSQGKGELMYQKRAGKSASVVWHVPLVAAKKKRRFNGTVARYLHKMGLDISTRAKLTSAMRRQLAAKGHFATYSYHPMNGGYANVIKPDGATTPTRKSDDAFSITIDEKELLSKRR